MENKNNFSHLRKFLAVWLLGILIPLIILNIAKTLFFNSFLYSSNFSLIIFIIVFLILQLLVISGIIYFFDKESFKTDKEPINFFKNLGIAFFLGVGFILILNIFVKLPYLIGGSYQMKELINENIIQFNSLPYPFLITLVIVSISALFEEILFRGFLQRNLLKFFNPIGAILITSFIFSLFHFQINNFYPILFLSVFLGVIYYKFWLKTVIIVHLFINIFSSSFLYFNNSVYNKLWFDKEDFGNKPNFLARDLNKNSEIYYEWYEIYLPYNKIIYKEICSTSSTGSVLQNCYKKNKDLITKELQDSIKILEIVKEEDKDNLKVIEKVIEENKNTIDSLELKE